MWSTSKLRFAVMLPAVLGASTAAWAGEPAANASVFVVARPEMPDPLFAQTVILMLPGSQDFPLLAGLIVNKPIGQLTLRKLFPDDSALKSRMDTAFFGGPVDIEAPAIVFRSGQAIDGATRLGGDVYVSLDPGLAIGLAKDPRRAKDFRLILGRAQWTVDQLHSEILEGSWYMVRADPGIVFSSTPDSLWAKLTSRARSISAAAIGVPGAGPLTCSGNSSAGRRCLSRGY
jgi:putative AlgH/UPF0301 family transcriptional regulator